MQGKLLLILLPVLLIACAGAPLSDDAGTNASAYLAGRVSYIGAAEVADQIVTVKARKAMFTELEEEYRGFLVDTLTIKIVSPEQSVALFNSLVFIMVGYVDDPHALLSDLSYMLQLYGAQFVEGVNGEPKKMVSIDPVPRSVYFNFDLGWHVSRRMKQRPK